jgi:hypothetical protein
MFRRPATFLLLIAFLAISNYSQLRLDAGEPRLRSIYGSEHALSEFQEEATEAYVLVFLDPYCPVAQQYLPRLAELSKKYNGFESDRVGRPLTKDSDGRWKNYRYKGDRVCFLGIYPTVDQSIKDIATHALDMSIPFRVLHDHRQETKKKYQVTELAEVVLLDKDWKVFYQGTIDNQFFPGGSKPKPTEHYLRDAIDALLAGKDIAVKQRPPQGCIIAERSTEGESSSLTFHEHIEAIIQAKCQECHRPGAVGPMPLITYSDVSSYAEMIEEVVRDKRMPPWPGESKLAMKHDYRLTSRETEKLIAWIRGGRKKGDIAKAPEPVKWPELGRWTIGDPDFVFEMKNPIKIPANGVVDYAYYPIKVDFPEDKYIRAIEVVPGDPRAVHHIQVHEYRQPVDENAAEGASAFQLLSLYGASLGNAHLLGNYSPGNNANARVFDAESGVKLKRGSNLILELHYTPFGQETSDQSRVGISFTDRPPKREIKSHYYIRKIGDFLIPANQHHHSMQQLYHFEKPVRIIAVRPHMHSRGKSFRLDLVNSSDVRLKDIHDRAAHGKKRGEVLLSVPNWDFGWQLTYEFEKPIIVPRGKALLATAFWDNSRQNPRNPDWKADVEWGQQLFHEMFNVMIIYEELDSDEIANGDSLQD